MERVAAHQIRSNGRMDSIIPDHLGGRERDLRVSSDSCKKTICSTTAAVLSVHTRVSHTNDSMLVRGNHKLMFRDASRCSRAAKVCRHITGIMSAALAQQ